MEGKNKPSTTAGTGHGPVVLLKFVLSTYILIRFRKHNYTLFLLESIEMRLLEDSLDYHRQLDF